MMLKNAMNDGGLLCDNLVRDLLIGLLFREGNFVDIQIYYS